MFSATCLSSLKHFYPLAFTQACATVHAIVTLTLTHLFPFLTVLLLMNVSVWTMNDLSERNDSKFEYLKRQFACPYKNILISRFVTFRYKWQNLDCNALFCIARFTWNREAMTHLALNGYFVLLSEPRHRFQLPPGAPSAKCKPQKHAFWASGHLLWLTFDLSVHWRQLKSWEGKDDS